jgi:hypothetical protein
MLQFTFIRISSCYSSLLGLGLMFLGGRLGSQIRLLGQAGPLCYRTGPRPTKGRTDAERRGTEREAGAPPQKDQPRAIPRGRMDPHDGWAQGRWVSEGPRSRDQRGVQGHWTTGPKVNGPVRGPRTRDQRGVQGHWTTGPKVNGPVRGPRTRDQRGVQGHWTTGPKVNGPVRGPRTRDQRGVQGHWTTGPKVNGPVRGPRTRDQRGVQGHWTTGPKDTGGQ